MATAGVLTMATAEGTGGSAAMPTDFIVPAKTTTARRGSHWGSAGHHNGNGDWPSHGPAPAIPANAASMGMAFALAAIAMLFVAFTTTYLGTRQDAGWKPIPLPWILWLDTGILLASSVAMESGRRRLRSGDARGLRRGLTVGGALGVVFLVGQLVAWQQLLRQGVYLSSYPHSSFFYLLTGAHGLHLLGGLVAIAAILPRAWRGAFTSPGSAPVTLVSIYWHFLTGLWLYVFVIMFWL
jgi:cytochrome c oxidase subunit III